MVIKHILKFTANEEKERFSLKETSKSIIRLSVFTQANTIVLQL
jgi:hypothetical protein